MASGLLERFGLGSRRSDGYVSADLTSVNNWRGGPTEEKSWRLDTRIIADATIGLSDGLTVPFALTAGLSALGDSRIVVLGGLAELLAGAISMGLGGWLAARTEYDGHKTDLRSTQQLVRNSPQEAVSILHDRLAPLLPNNALPLLDDLKQQILLQNEKSLPADSQAEPNTPLTELLMCLQHHRPTSQPNRALISATTIASGYFAGGFVPLIPYFLCSEIGRAFWWSVGVMVVALGVFGFVKTLLILPDHSTEDDDEALYKGSWSRASRSRMNVLVECTKGGLVMVCLGVVAAAAAMSLVTVFAGGQGNGA